MVRPCSHAGEGLDEEKKVVKSPGDISEKYSSAFDKAKAEAMSLRHLLLHLPKNDFCQTCQRAKMQRKPGRRVKKKLGPLPTKYGEEGTCDHWIAKNELSKGIDGDTVGLMYRDRATKWVDCRGMTSKSSAYAGVYLTEIRSSKDEFKYFHTDGSHELKKCLDDMYISYDHPVPDDLNDNSRAERSKSMLYHDGLPIQFGPLDQKGIQSVSYTHLTLPTKRIV